MAQQLYKNALNKIKDLDTKDWVLAFKDSGTIVERVRLSDFIDTLGLAKAGSVKNFAENDLNFTANRTHNLKDKDLILNNSNSFYFRAGLETGAVEEVISLITPSKSLTTSTNTITSTISTLNVGDKDVSLSYSNGIVGYNQEIKTGSLGNIISSTREQVAALDVSSTVGGFMAPRVTTVQRDAMSPATSWLVYNTDDNEYQFYNGTIWSPVGGLWVENANGIHYTGGNVGIGVTTVDSKFNVEGANGSFKLRLDNENGDSTSQLLLTSDEPTYTNFMSVGTTTANCQLQWGIIGPSSTANDVGTVKDGFLLATSEANDMNFINNAGTGTTDNIAFYAGKTVGTNLSTTTSDITILGGGASKGYVGIGLDTPTEKLEIAGSVKIVDGTEQNGYVLTCDATGKGTWQALAGGVTLGSYHQVPYMNGTTDFQYSDNIRYNGTTFSLTDGSQAAANSERLFIKNTGDDGIKIEAYINNSSSNIDSALSTSNNFAENIVFSTTSTHAAPTAVMGMYSRARDNSTGYSTYTPNKSAAFFHGSWQKGTGYALYSIANENNSGDNIAGYFEASNAGAGNAYALQVVDGNQGTGKVLTSDASGNASWEDLAISGTGISTRLALWTSSNTLIYSQFYESGNNTSVGTAPQSNRKFSVLASSSDALDAAIYGFNAATKNTGFNSGVEGNSSGSVTGHSGVWGNVGGKFGASGSDLFNYGVNVTSTSNSTGTNVAGYFEGRNNGAGEGYALRIVDDNQGAGKVLTSDADGYATWGTISADNMTTTEKNAIVAPATGLMVFDSTLAKLCVYTGSAWETVTSS